MLLQDKFILRGWGGTWGKELSHRLPSQAVLSLDPQRKPVSVYSSLSSQSIHSHYPHPIAYSLLSPRENCQREMNLAFAYVFLWVPKPLTWTFWNIRIFCLFSLVYQVQSYHLPSASTVFYSFIIMLTHFSIFVHENACPLPCWVSAVCKKRQDAVWWAWK